MALRRHHVEYQFQHDIISHELDVAMMTTKMSYLKPQVVSFHTSLPFSLFLELGIYKSNYFLDTSH